MTFADLLLLHRERTDDTVVPYGHSDTECAGYFNDAQRQAAIRKRLIFDNSTEDVCVFSVDAVDDAVGISTITHHPRMLAVRSARWSENLRPLILRTLKAMDRDYPEWPTKTAGEPTHLIVDRETSKIDLWPTPDVDGVLTLAVWRSPLDEEQIFDDDFDLDPVIDETFQRDLLDWTEHLACLKKDSEQYDPRAAAAAEQRFTDKFGPLPSAHQIKCWGLSPSRGQRAEFM